MIYKIQCPDCLLTIGTIDKPEITQEDKDMYGQNMQCQICKHHLETKGSFLKGIISFLNRLLRKLHIRK